MEKSLCTILMIKFYRFIVRIVFDFISIKVSEFDWVLQIFDFARIIYDDFGRVDVAFRFAF